METVIVELVRDLIIGLISGSVSSLLVSVKLKKHWDKEQKEKDFEKEKQVFERYLSSLREELLIGSKIGDYSFFIRKLENEPIRPTFEQLDKKGKKSIKKISLFLKTIKNEFEASEVHSEKRIKEINSRLYQFEIDVLNYRQRND